MNIDMTQVPIMVGFLSALLKLGGSYLASKFLGKKQKQSSTGPSFMTKKIEDPLKQAVASPLSKYLATNVGKGLPQYEGPLTSELGPDVENRYSEFLNLDAGDWFNKYVAEPETTRFEEDVLPLIDEGFAGRRYGSGLLRARGDALSKFSSALTQQRGKAELEIPKAQFDVAFKMKEAKDADYITKYNAWAKTLPEYNPLLSKALNFLGQPTGTDYLSALDPGRKGSFLDSLSSAFNILKSIDFGNIFGGGTTSSTTSSPSS